MGEMGDGVGDKREFIDIARRTVPCRSTGLGADEAGLAFKPHCPPSAQQITRRHGGWAACRGPHRYM